jgi:hypothetical protein
MKPIVKTAILVVISALAVVLGLILIVVLNRVLKKANEAKRRSIRQQQRAVIDQQLRKSLSEATEPTAEPVTDSSIVSSVPQEPAIASSSIPSAPEKQETAKPAKSRDATPPPVHVPDFLKTDQDFDILAERLELQHILKSKQLDRLRLKKPRSLLDMVRCIEEEFASQTREQPEDTAGQISPDTAPPAPLSLAIEAVD